MIGLLVLIGLTRQRECALPNRGSGARITPPQERVLRNRRCGGPDRPEVHGFAARALATVAARTESHGFAARPPAPRPARLDGSVAGPHRNRRSRARRPDGPPPRPASPPAPPASRRASPARSPAGRAAPTISPSSVDVTRPPITIFASGRPTVGVRLGGAVGDVEVVGVALDPPLDERADRQGLASAFRPELVECRLGDRGADPPALAGRVDLGVGEDDELVGELVLGEAGRHPVHARLETGLLAVVSDGDAHGSPTVDRTDGGHSRPRRKRRLSRSSGGRGGASSRWVAPR